MIEEGVDVGMLRQLVDEQTAKGMDLLDDKASPLAFGLGPKLDALQELAARAGIARINKGYADLNDECGRAKLTLRWFLETRQALRASGEDDSVSPPPHGEEDAEALLSLVPDIEDTDYLVH